MKRLFLFLIIALFATVAFAGKVKISWNANTESDLAGYKVYYGTSSGVYSNTIDVGDTTSVIVDSLTQGFTYFFAVTAYDTAGNESIFSSEVSAFIPLPPDTTGPFAPTNVIVEVIVQ